MAYAFTSNELWTLGIAAYAAVVSTFVLGWDAYKWLASGPKIDMSASLNMMLIGGTEPDPKTYVSITAYNVGDRPTTITNLGGMHFDSWWNAYITKRKAKKSFIVNQPSQAQPIPYRFDVGNQWMGLMEQTDDILQMAKNGYLFLTLYTAQSGHGHRVRVKFKKSAAKS